MCESQYAGPSHPDVENGRYPFRAIDPEGLDQNSYNSDPPNNGKQNQSGTSFQSDQTDWSIASGDKDKDHHVIDLFQYRIYFVYTSAYDIVRLSDV